MKISGVRVTKDLLIKNKAARALLKAGAQCRDGFNELSIVVPISLVESSSWIEMPFSDSVRERAGAEPTEMWPHLFPFKGRSQAEAQSHAC